MLADAEACMLFCAADVLEPSLFFSLSPSLILDMSLRSFHSRYPFVGLILDLSLRIPSCGWDPQTCMVFSAA